MERMKVGFTFTRLRHNADCPTAIYTVEYGQDTTRMLIDNVSSTGVAANVCSANGVSQVIRREMVDTLSPDATLIVWQR